MLLIRRIAGAGVVDTSDLVKVGGAVSEARIGVSGPGDIGGDRRSGLSTCCSSAIEVVAGRSGDRLPS